MHLNRYMDDLLHRSQKSLVMIRRTGIVRDDGKKNSKPVRPNRDQVKIGNPVIGIGLDGRLHTPRHRFVGIPVQKNRAALPRQTKGP